MVVGKPNAKNLASPTSIGTQTTTCWQQKFEWMAPYSKFEVWLVLLSNLFSRLLGF